MDNKPSRQVVRAGLRAQYFERYNGTEMNSTKRKPVRLLSTRRERRNLARAFASRAWRNAKYSGM